MNVLQQDRRYLLLLVSAVMNQKKVPVMSGSLMPWRTIYRLADTNQVANLCWHPGFKFRDGQGNQGPVL